MSAILSLETLKLAALSLVGWIALAAYFAVAEKWARIPFVVAHYALSIGVFLGLILLYTKYLSGTVIPSPFIGMIICMVALFCIEILFFGFVYDKPLTFLNFTDWIVPVFLIASTIYLTLANYAKI
jgi:ABC-type proline/glycine betaine transport system permease subunit